MAKKVTKSDVPPIEAAPVKTNALALVNHAGIQVDDDGRKFLPIVHTARPEGGENIKSRGVKLSKIKILEAMSAEIKSKETRVEGAEIGMFYHTGTDELADKLELVPLYVYNERYYNGTGGGNLVCMSIDGKAIYGTCPSGAYAEHSIPTKFIKVEDRDIEVGMCDTCPNSQREWDKPSPCQFNSLLVCASLEFIERWEETVPLILAEDRDAISDLLNELVVLPFKGSRLKKLNKIADQAEKDGSFFRWGWKIGSFEDGDDVNSWQNYTVTRARRLTPDEMVFARSLYKFVQKVRPTITAQESEIQVEEPEEQPKTEVNLDG